MIRRYGLLLQLLLARRPLSYLFFIDITEFFIERFLFFLARGYMFFLSFFTPLITGFY